MNEIWLKLSAPFAAFRYFQAGVFRSTSPIIPFSAAWGLALNLAGIEVRTDVDGPVTQIDPNAPKLRLALGAIEFGEKITLYQQLHTYPVGASGKEFVDRAKGSKYWIVPAKRELLAGLNCVVGVQSEDPEIINRIQGGVEGKLGSRLYGLPFAGDNNLLFDDIRVSRAPQAAHWYTPVCAEKLPVKGSCRLSVKIDRVDSSKSVSALYAPTAQLEPEPPDSAWTWTPEAPT